MHLSDYMTEKKLTDDDVATAIGRVRVSVSRYRRRLVRPDWEAIDAIETFTGGAVGPSDWKEIEEPAAAGPETPPATEPANSEAAE
ncbi:MAG: family transcriptional regulator [Bradyrhizobium sp.]|jgi:hypothetical protein|nr:family transcriptional regulator [Bradyrhizobium sp.]